jgi:hypothetical protein
MSGYGPGLVRARGAECGVAEEGQDRSDPSVHLLLAGQILSATG